MTLGISKKLLAAMVCAVVLNSCKQYEDGPAFELRTATNRLTGEWELVEIAGPEEGEMDDNMTYIFEFDKDGDFKWDHVYESGMYRIAGEWEWDNQKDELEMEFEGLVMEANVMVLTKDQLKFSWGYCGHYSEWTFEKVD